MEIPTLPAKAGAVAAAAMSASAAMSFFMTSLLWSIPPGSPGRWRGDCQRPPEPPRNGAIQVQFSFGAPGRPQALLAGAQVGSRLLPDVVLHRLELRVGELGERRHAARRQ